MTYRLAASFKAQDDAAFADGRGSSAHNMRRAHDNLNYLSAKLVHPVLSISWDVKAGEEYRLTPLAAVPVIEHQAVFQNADFQYARLRVYAKVENGKMARLNIVNALRPRDASGSGSGFAMAGDGTWKTYPTAGTWLVRMKPGVDFLTATVQSGSAPVAVTAIDAALGGPISTGVIDDTGYNWIEDTGADFSGCTFDGGLYLRTFATNDESQPRSGPFLVGGLRSAGSNAIIDFGVGPGAPRIGEYWRLYRGPQIDLGAISLYEQPRTSVARGVDEALSLTRQRFSFACSSLPADLALHMNRTRLRKLACIVTRGSEIDLNGSEGVLAKWSREVIATLSKGAVGVEAYATIYGGSSGGGSVVLPPEALTISISSSNLAGGDIVTGDTVSPEPLRGGPATNTDSAYSVGPASVEPDFSTSQTQRLLVLVSAEASFKMLGVTLYEVIPEE